MFKYKNLTLSPDLFQFVTAGGFLLAMKSLNYAVIFMMAAACFLGVNSQCGPGSVPETCERVIMSRPEESCLLEIALCLCHENLNLFIHTAFNISDPAQSRLFMCRSPSPSPSPFPRVALQQPY